MSNYWAIKIETKEAKKFDKQYELAEYVGTAPSTISKAIKHIRFEYNGYIISKFDNYPGPDMKYFVKNIDTGNIETFNKLQDAADMLKLHWTALTYIINYEQGIWKNYNIKPEKTSNGKPFLGEERIIINKRNGRCNNTNASRKCWLTNVNTQETKEFPTLSDLGNYIGISISVIVRKLNESDGMTCTLGNYIIKAEPMRNIKKHYNKYKLTKKEEPMKKEENFVGINSGLMLKLCFQYNEILKMQYKKYGFKELYDFLKWMDDNMFVYEELKKINIK